MDKGVCPLVSIVIPVYNGSNYLREAIDSALAQTYPNVEVLVVNDGSTDGGATRDIAMSYSDKIRYFQKENGGAVSALNYGIDQMRGEYFAWLSHDDLYDPAKIEKQVLALQNHQGERPAFCICNCTFIDESGKELYRSYVRQDHEFDKPACFLFLGSVGFNGIMVLIPKTLFERIGQFTPSLATHEYDMWLRIMAVADVVVEPECLSHMRIHPEQVSKRNSQDTIKEIDLFIGNGIRDIPPLDFQTFVLNRVCVNGIKYAFELLNSYLWYQHTPYSAAQTLAQFRLMFDKPEGQAKDFFAQMLGISNIDEVREYSLHRVHSDKPLITIYCETITDAALQELSIGMALLLMQHDIVLLYHRIEADTLTIINDIGVMAIGCATVDENIALRISVMCYLLGAKLLWYYDTGNVAQYAKAFQFLKGMEIGTIGSFHDVGTVLANQQSVCFIEHGETKNPLAEALLATSCVQPQTWSASFFAKLVVMPNEPLQALARWKMVFSVLLGGTEYAAMEKKMKEQLSTILAKSQFSVTEYVNDYVRSFLAEVDQRTALQISTYEQRTFWKLTKPLRLGAWLMRKSGKAIRMIFKRDESMRSIASRVRMALKNRSVSQ